MVAAGDSSWASSTAASAITGRCRSTNCGASAALAPAPITMLLRPCGVDVDAGGAGRQFAGAVAQVDAVGGRQRARELAAGVVAERADEAGLGAGARRGHGLVEALAAGAGGVVAAERFARARQRRTGPHVVDIERTDDDAPKTCAAVRTPQCPGRSARRRSSRSSAWRWCRPAPRAGRSGPGPGDVPARVRRCRRSGSRSS